MYKGINRRLWISKIFLVATVATWNFTASAQNIPYPKVGSFFTTYYYVPLESQYPNVQDAELKDIHGNVLAKVNAQFKKDTDVEGTGILRNGVTVNYAKRINNEIRYRISTSKYGWGVGQCKLVPYRTIAVDPAVIRLGTTVFIPAAKGMVLPDGTIHDGLFQAEDIGSKINSLHVDFFSAEGRDAGKIYEKVGIKTGVYVDLYKVKDPTPGGCQDLPETGIDDSPGALLSARLQALVKLADEFAALGLRDQMHLAFSKIYEIKSEWEALGRPSPNEKIVASYVTIEREAIQREVLQVQLDDFLGLRGRYKNDFDGTSLKRGEVVITFDDGPNPHLTPMARKITHELGVPAAFFEVGENVELYGDQTASLAASGQIIGNHSYSHADFVKLSDYDIADQIARTQSLIASAIKGVAPEFLRSPYGSRNKRTMAIISKSFYHIMWNIDSLDWNDHSPESIENRVFDQLSTEGYRGVILMHDIHPQTIEAIKTILPRMKKEGYKFLNLYQMVNEKLVRGDSQE